MAIKNTATVARGTVQSFIHANGHWLAVVTALRAKGNGPILSHIVPVTELKGSARRKADRWLRELA